MTENELLPCPFCGTQPLLEERGNDFTKTRQVTIKCPKCRVQLKNKATVRSLDWLTCITKDAWNSRK